MVMNAQSSGRACQGGTRSVRGDVLAPRGIALPVLSWQHRSGRPARWKSAAGRGRCAAKGEALMLAAPELLVL